MPLSNLRKLALLDTDITENSREMQRVVNLCYNKPLYYSWWEPKHEQKYHKTNGNCCIWHILGPEKKDGKLMPMLPYQKLLYQTLQGHKCIWLKKSRGLGVTTFMLYYIAYLCLTVLNKVKVEVFPSHHIDTMRGLDRVKSILSDETDYYPPFQQKELRAVMEGYIGKPNSDPTIALVSTPKAPGGLMQQIELEQNSLYYKLFFDYTYGLEGPQPIYSVAQIEQAKRSPDFRREYAGEYLGLIGNCFNISSINRAVMHGTKYSELSQDNWTKGVHTLLSIDPVYGSVSKYAIVMCQYLDQKIVVIYAKEYTKPDYSDMIDEVFR